MSQERHRALTSPAKASVPGFMRGLWRIVTTPACWDRCGKTDKAWSAEVNRLLDSGAHFTEIRQHTAKLGGIEIWIRTYPSIFGCRYSLGDRLMPDRATVFRMKDQLERDKRNARGAKRQVDRLLTDAVGACIEEAISSMRRGMQ